MCDIRPGLTDISFHLAHDTDVLVAVEQGVFVVSTRLARPAAMRGTIGLQTGIGQHDDKPLGIFIVGSDRDMLFGHELREFWRRTGLGPFHIGVSV